MNISNMLFGKEWKELKSFENLSESQRSIIFYAENEASINHFNSLIHELTENMNLNICYVTSVKDDPIHKNLNSKIKSFYIGDGTVRTKFFLNLKAKILIMDMPDLETYHIKRSKIYPVHYIYIFHSIFSTHSYLRKGAVDNYDTIFCVGPHHKNEIQETEKIYNLKPKNLISFGFPRLDNLLNEKQNYPKNFNVDDNLILLTPSYGKNNLLETCGFELIKILLESNFKVLLRPHFKILKDSKKLISKILDEFGNNPNFSLENGIIPSKSFHSSICMISDWSGISFEYAFTFERPVIFIDVPKKILNPNFNDISLEPIEISYRDKLGFVVSPNELKLIPDLIYKSKNNRLSTIESIQEIRSKTIFNLGKSAIIGAKYIQKLTKEL